MTDRVNADSINDAGRLEAENLTLDPALLVPDLAELPNPETFTVMVTTVLQPWAIESEETVSGALRNFVAPELEQLGSLTTGQLAWAVADLVVARQAEVLALGDPEAQQGLANLAEQARMFEHVFLANSGTALDGQPA